MVNRAVTNENLGRVLIFIKPAAAESRRACRLPDVALLDLTTPTALGRLVVCSQAELAVDFIPSMKDMEAKGLSFDPRFHGSNSKRFLHNAHLS